MRGIRTRRLQLQRERCIEQMVKRNLPGYAIGGLAGGEGGGGERWR
jgi:queuine/archaeosine tRNA-ribosyltransferase